MARDGSATLSDLAGGRLNVVCDRCGRRGSYSVARLMRERGDLRLTDFLSEVAADCPRRGSLGLYDRCGARFERRGRG
jgi:hypothetical protein